MSATRAAATLLRGGAGRAGPSLLPLPRALALRGPLAAARRFCATEAAAAPLSPKVQQLVDEIAGLTLLEASNFATETSGLLPRALSQNAPIVAVFRP